MRTSLKAAFPTKTRGTFPVGTSFDVTMVSDSIAMVTPDSGDPFKVRAIALGKYFKGFVKFTPGGVERMFEQDSAICKSLTGKIVEPDGHDEHGFPSVLLAAGYV